MISDYDKWLKQTGFPDITGQEPDRIDEIVEHLRDTLTDEMATKAYRIRYKTEPNGSTLESFKEKLVNEHYDEGFGEWVERYLYFDPGAGR